jgi:hypothetical protein
MATLLARAPVSPEIRPWMSAMIRLGYAAKGIIYLLIGTFAFRMAMGLDGGRVTDASGALRTFLRQPFGLILLTAIGIGILVYSAWQVAEGLLDTRRKGSGVRGWTDRVLTIIKGGVYGVIGWEAMQLVAGVRGASPGADDYARDVIQVPLGNWFLALVGLGVAAYGVLQIRNAWQGKFDDDLDAQRLRSEAGGWPLLIGRVGTSARGVLLTVMGVLLLRAGFDSSPSKAGGMADSMWTIFAQPYGAWLLAAAAVGLACFGFFQLLHSRYARL